MSEPIPAALRASIRERARFKCEYCLIHDEDSAYSHEIDHIIARKHLEDSSERNLAWACFVCNRLKGSDIASIDLETGKVVRLFNPRKDKWIDHFRLEGARIVPLTPEARVTEHLLQFNHLDNMQMRENLIKAQRYPR